MQRADAYLSGQDRFDAVTADPARTLRRMASFYSTKGKLTEVVLASDAWLAIAACPVFARQAEEARAGIRFSFGPLRLEISRGRRDPVDVLAALVGLPRGAVKVLSAPDQVDAGTAYLKFSDPISGARAGVVMVHGCVEDGA